MRTYRVHLTQSGSTRAEGLNCYAGRSDAALSAYGENELRDRRNRYPYPSVERVYGSPLLRARQTAGILYTGAPFEAVEELTAYHMGVFQGKTFQELKDDPDFRGFTNNPYRYPPPGGEDCTDFVKRGIDAMGSVYSRMQQRGEQEVAVLTHSENISYICHTIGIPRRPLQNWGTAPGAGYTLLFTPHMWERDGLAEIYARMPGDDIAFKFDTYWRDAD